MRTLNVEEISKNIKEMCIEANHFLSKDMDIAMKNAVSTEKSPLGKKILSQLQDNLKIAGKDMIPICQDTGMAVVFLEIGQDVHFEGGNLEVVFDIDGQVVPYWLHITIKPEKHRGEQEGRATL